MGSGFVAILPGSRAEPVWGISDSDFKEDKNGNGLDTFLTIFLVENRNEGGVLEALKRGRVYAVRKTAGFRLSLDQFEIADEGSGRNAIMGEELRSDSKPVVEGRISSTDGGHHSVNVAIIRGGEKIWSFEGETPLKFRFVDPGQWSGKTFYRLDVSGKAAGKLLSNPIFVVRN